MNQTTLNQKLEELTEEIKRIRRSLARGTRDSIEVPKPEDHKSNQKK